jgi:hypothetical protein
MTDTFGTLKGKSKLEWRRSSFCTETNCVQVAFTEVSVLIRNSAAETGTLAVSLDAWESFISRLKFADDQ